MGVEPHSENASENREVIFATDETTGETHPVLRNSDGEILVAAEITADFETTSITAYPADPIFIIPDGKTAISDVIYGFFKDKTQQVVIPDTEVWHIRSFEIGSMNEKKGLEGRLKYSTNGGSTWTVVKRKFSLGTTQGPYPVTLDLTGSGTNTIIALEGYTGGDDITMFLEWKGWKD